MRRQSAYSIELDGSDDYVGVTPFTFPTAAGSLHFWYRPDAVTDGTILRIIKTSPLKLFDVVMFSGDFFAGWYDNGAESRVTIANPTQIGPWVHGVLTWASGSNTELYLNGTLVGIDTHSLASWDTSTADAFRFGLTNSNTIPFDGGLDDIALFDFVLSKSEREGLGSGLIDPADLAPVALWRFDDGTGTTTVDEIGSADGTLTNGAAWSKKVPQALRVNNLWIGAVQPDGRWIGAVTPAPAAPSGTTQITSTFASVVAFGSALLTNTRHVDETAATTVTFGAGLLTNTRHVDETISSTVTFGAISQTVKLDSTFASTVVFGSALVTNTQKVSTTYAASVTLGAADLSNTRHVDSTAAASVSVGAASVDVLRSVSSTQAAAVTFGAALATNTRHVTLTTSSTVVFGDASLLTEGEFSALVVASTVFGSVLATNTQHVDGSIPATVTVGAALLTNRQKVNATFPAGSSFGSANLSNTRKLTQTISSTVVFGSATLQGGATAVLLITSQFEASVVFGPNGFNLIYPEWYPSPRDYQFPFSHSPYTG